VGSTERQGIRRWFGLLLTKQTVPKKNGWVLIFGSKFHGEAPSKFWHGGSLFFPSKFRVPFLIAITCVLKYKFF
jgi:hypothetical protein